LSYLFDDYSLDVERRELRRGSELIPIEPLAFDLLEFLIRNRERVVSKDNLIASVWNGRIVSESTLTSRMNSVRHAVGDNGEHQRLIRTVPRKGFRFVGDVREKQNPLDLLETTRPQMSRDEAARPLPTSDHPAVSFTQMLNGTHLAVSASGDGPPLVRAAHWVNHIEHEWQSPLVGPLLQRLSRRFRLVRYDGRGTGLSDRNVPDMSFARYQEDLEAVTNALKLERFALLGISGGAANAIGYAARHPERVSKLVLSGGYALGRNKRSSPQSTEEAQAFITMLRSGWGNEASPFWRASSSFFLPNATPEQRKWHYDLQHTAFTVVDSMVSARQAVDAIDVLDFLPLVRAPTIVFHSRRDNLVPFEQGRLIAASIPGAKLVPLESENHFLLETEPAWSKFVGEMEAFLTNSE